MVVQLHLPSNYVFVRYGACVLLQCKGRCRSRHRPRGPSCVEIHRVDVVFPFHPPFCLSQGHGRLVRTQKRAIECRAPIDGETRARCLDEYRNVRVKQGQLGR